MISTSSFFQKIQLNWKSGLTVGLVSIPLAVSLAVASNTTPVAGVITAIWAGLIASILGGSNYNIIGPTGALAGVLIIYTKAYGSECLPMLAILTGVFIFVAYLFKLENYLMFIPGSALHGFILGVALIIVLGQLGSILGLPALPAHESLLGNVCESFRNIALIYWPSFITFILFYIGLMLFSFFCPRLPGTIVLAPVGILVGYLCSSNIIPWTVPTLGSKYPGMSASLFQLPSFTFSLGYLLPAVSIAVIAILETMISARIADGITKTRHDKRKEMLGLSLANIGCGCAGGIPATAALARTALNIKSGGTDKMSATLSSVFIAVLSLSFLFYFQYLPMAVIAAILVYVSSGMLETEHFWYMYKLDKKNFVISLIVAFLTVYEDAIVGIMFGVVVAMLLLMQRLSTGYHEIMIKSHKAAALPGDKRVLKEPQTYIYSIKGAFAYINAQSHFARLETIPDNYTDVILNLRDVHFIDLDGVEALGDITTMLSNKGKRVFFADLNPVVEQLLAGNHVFETLKATGRVYSTVNDALTAIAQNQ
jgi:sulfate permease, SulP family